MVYLIISIISAVLGGIFCYIDRKNTKYTFLNNFIVYFACSFLVCFIGFLIYKVENNPDDILQNKDPLEQILKDTKEIKQNINKLELKINSLKNIEMKND